MNTRTKILIFGAKGLVGSALIRISNHYGMFDVVGYTREQVDCLKIDQIRSVISKEKPNFVIIAAAKVGGVQANTVYPADFLMENLSIQQNIFEACFEYSVERVLFLASSCVYPADASGVISEEDLLGGYLHESVKPYALAKIAGMEMVNSYNKQHGTDYRCIVPCNIYGPGDRYDLQNSHVIPALIMKFHNAKLSKHPFVEVWGDGTARREFLYVDDLAHACFITLLTDKAKFQEISVRNSSYVNASPNQDVSISDISKMLKNITQYDGEIFYNTSMPTGVEKKVLNSKRIHSLGWNIHVSLEEGLSRSYADFMLRYK